LSTSCTQHPARVTRYTATHSRQHPRARAYWSQNSSLAQCSGMSGFVGVPLTPLRAANCARSERHVGICYQLPMALTRPEPSEKPCQRCTQLSSCPCRRRAREASCGTSALPVVDRPLAGVLGVVLGFVRLATKKVAASYAASSIFCVSEAETPPFGGVSGLLPDLHFAQVGRFQSLAILRLVLAPLRQRAGRPWRWIGTRLR
jgi:hypothetical protein